MPLELRKAQLAIKVEGVEGVAETIAAADVVSEVEDLDWSFTNEMNERNPLRSTYSGVPLVPGMTMGVITGRVELVGGGAAGTKPPADLYLRALGYSTVLTTYSTTLQAGHGDLLPGEKATVDSGTIIRIIEKLADGTLYYAHVSGLSPLSAGDTITGTLSGETADVQAAAPTELNYAYFPNSDAPESFTVAGYEDGIRMLAYGCRGNGSLQVEGVGRLLYLQFELSGASDGPEDAALLTGLTLPSITPQSFLSAGVVVQDGALVCIDGVTVDINNTVAARRCANAATGIKSYRITDRKPTISISPEAELEADVDFWATYNAGDLFSYFARVGSAASKRCSILAPQAQYAGIDRSEREGLRVYDANLRCCGQDDAGDDEMWIAFY